MVFIYNKHIPEEAVSNLKQYGDCFPFLSNDITNSYLSGHIDVFGCLIDDKYIVSNELYNFLINISPSESINGIKIIKGHDDVGFDYDATHYNAAVSDNYIIHNTKYTDEVILQNKDNRQLINVKQGFCRCSVLPLSNDNFITSDNGITKQLKTNNMKHLFVDPSEIILPGCKNGCIGGCFGVYKTDVYCIGNLSYHKDGDKIRNFIEECDCHLIELYDGPLFDGGSITIL